MSGEGSSGGSGRQSLFRHRQRHGGQQQQPKRFDEPRGQHLETGRVLARIWTVSSWFTLYNGENLENRDIDMNSSGIMLIPGTTLAVGGGKRGIAYLVNRDNMGGLSTSTTATMNIIQSFAVSVGSGSTAPWCGGMDPPRPTVTSGRHRFSCSNTSLIAPPINSSCRCLRKARP